MEKILAIHIFSLKHTEKMIRPREDVRGGLRKRKKTEVSPEPSIEAEPVRRPREPRAAAQEIRTVHIMKPNNPKMYTVRVRNQNNSKRPLVQRAIMLQKKMKNPGPVHGAIIPSLPGTDSLFCSLSHFFGPPRNNPQKLRTDVTRGNPVVSPSFSVGFLRILPYPMRDD